MDQSMDESNNGQIPSNFLKELLTEFRRNDAIGPIHDTKNRPLWPQGK